MRGSADVFQFENKRLILSIVTIGYLAENPSALTFQLSSFKLLGYGYIHYIQAA